MSVEAPYCCHLWDRSFLEDLLVESSFEVEVREVHTSTRLHFTEAFTRIGSRVDIPCTLAAGGTEEGTTRTAKGSSAREAAVGAGATSATSPCSSTTCWQIVFLEVQLSFVRGHTHALRREMALHPF